MHDVFLVVVSMWAVLEAGNCYAAKVVDEAVTEDTEVVTGDSLDKAVTRPLDERGVEFNQIVVMTTT